jgi:hypothetical protein
VRLNTPCAERALRAKQRHRRRRTNVRCLLEGARRKGSGHEIEAAIQRINQSVEY